MVSMYVSTHSIHTCMHTHITVQNGTVLNEVKLIQLIVYIYLKEFILRIQNNKDTFNGS